MRDSHTETRQGFTLVELLVVIAIIAILVSLLLPAVNSAREAARRVQCQNNIRNLALAVVNYESANKKLPASNDAVMLGSTSNLYFTPPDDVNDHLSWMVRVLPFLEEQSIHDLVDFNVSVLDQDMTSNGGVPWFSSEISIAQCPSDAAAGLLYRDDTHTSNVPEGTGFAKGNYVAYVGPEHLQCQRVFRGALINEDQSLRKVKDGVSKTIVLTEVRTRTREDDQRGAWALAWIGSSVLALDAHSNTLPGSQSCDRLTPLGTRYVPDPTLLFKASPPNNPVGAWNTDQLRTCSNSAEADLLGMPCERESYLSAAPRSLHNGGVNVANLDCSVRFVVDDIDVGLLATSICINDGIATLESLD